MHITLLLFVLMVYVSVNNLTSTEQRIEWLTQEHNAVPPLIFALVTLPTEPLRSNTLSLHSIHVTLSTHNLHVPLFDQKL